MWIREGCPRFEDRRCLGIGGRENASGKLLDLFALLDQAKRARETQCTFTKYGAASPNGKLYGRTTRSSEDFDRSQPVHILQNIPNPNRQLHLIAECANISCLVCRFQFLKRL
jgi:hypothetical protein